MSKTKLIPFYFPQYHEILENNIWWGKGYTDWDRVKKAEPLLNSHYQPRIPFNKNYYDLSKSEAIEWQISLAEKFNIYGFSFYHYWFDGKLLLEKPLEIFKQTNHNLRYCITWANETWTKRWIGKGNEILIEQNHSEDRKIWSDHFEYLDQFFSDSRYIKIDGKPVFLIYRPDIINSLNSLLDYFNELAIKRGYSGIYFIGLESYQTLNPTIYKNFDAKLKFQPRQLFTSDFSENGKMSTLLERLLRSLPEKFQIPFAEVKYKLEKSKSYDYEDFCSVLIKNAKLDLDNEQRVFQSFIVDWDNTPRYGLRAKYFNNANPNNFEKYLFMMINLLEESEYNDEYLFLNAWNEWSEGAYLEPDEKHGYSYLEILKSANESL